MTRTLHHRGPDEQGSHLDPPVALGVRRLSVIDLHTGQQPIPNEDRTIWVVQNGEIYNFRALRRDLERRGHRFRTGSDTEVIVRAYEEFGEDCVDVLDGMFAFAIWDRVRQTLVLACDRMGEKPLYYFSSDEAFVFGSELRALLAHPAVPRNLSIESLSRYLAYEYVPAPHSIIAGVVKLPPGHLVTISPGSKPKLVQYWDLPLVPDPSLNEAEWAERLKGQLEASVRNQLVSDVPLGMFLSGGIDSSAIVALAARLNGGRPLKTFSLGFEERSYDERSFAHLVAQHCGTEHTELEFSANDARTLLDGAGHLFDEPLVDGSFLPIYMLSRAARRQVTVVLSGDGGDELFCGYPTFLAEPAAQWVHRVPAQLRRRLGWAVSHLPRSSRYGSVEFLLKQFVRGLPHPREVRTQLLLGGLTAAEQSCLLSPALQAACAGFDPYEELTATLKKVSGLAPLDQLIYQHCKFYLAGQNLPAVDRASMACGLEVRAPFLDRPMVELSSRVPANLKLRGWTTKYILKKALRGLLPQRILDRRKQGFGVPIGTWLRGPLRPVLEERLSRERVARVGLFNPIATQQLIAEHVRGDHDHRKILWALLIFDVWREHYLADQRWT